MRLRDRRRVKRVGSIRIFAKKKTCHIIIIIEYSFWLKRQKTRKTTFKSAFEHQNKNPVVNNVNMNRQKKKSAEHV